MLSSVFPVPGAVKTQRCMNSSYLCSSAEQRGFLALMSSTCGFRDQTEKVFKIQRKLFSWQITLSTLVLGSRAASGQIQRDPDGHHPGDEEGGAQQQCEARGHQRAPQLAGVHQSKLRQRGEGGRFPA